MALFDIFREDISVGNAFVETVGLYTMFTCRCNFQDKGIYRIIAQYGSVKIDLGICIPQEDGYATFAKIPTKNISNDVPQFYAIEGSQSNMIFIPVKTHETFDYITNLPEARFYNREGECGLLIRKS